MRTYTYIHRYTRGWHMLQKSWHMVPRGLHLLHRSLHLLIILLGAGELHFCGPEKKLTKVLSLSQMGVRPFLFLIQKA